MLAIEKLPERMPVLNLTINGAAKTIKPIDEKTTKIKLKDGTSLVITLENTGIDGQVEDWMYKGRYFDNTGNKMPGGHTFGTTHQLTNALNLILSKNQPIEI